ncbi:hypothetical protein DXA30_02855 [Fusobacterium ulcerans]|uniref:hypothetical protein n=1 Tax=Fusobacterium ulcerans TaxID=861 RepID=UPI000E535BA7|nr:hypothetical protein [Fusobacterium ulcerans]RGY66710.1 hypothetical protein DXA30_02855 [Fusobacterium ulcerans]
MKAFNSGNRKSKLIVRFLKGVGSVSLASPFLDKNGVAKKIGNKLSLKRHGFGCRPLVWKIADFIGNRGIILGTSMKRSPYGISNAQAYLKEVQSMEVSRKVASKWLNDYETGNGNRYKVYCWILRKNK